MYHYQRDTFRQLFDRGRVPYGVRSARRGQVCLEDLGSELLGDAPAPRVPRAARPACGRPGRAAWDAGLERWQRQRQRQRTRLETPCQELARSQGLIC